MGITLGEPTGGGTLAPARTSDNSDDPGYRWPQPDRATGGPTPVSASAGFVQVPVTRFGGLGDEVAYNFSTVDGTAVAGRDYTPASGTLVLAPGVATGYVDIPSRRTTS